MPSDNGCGKCIYFTGRGFTHLRINGKCDCKCHGKKEVK